MSDDFFCIRFDHRISYLAAKFIKLPIISPFVLIIHSLAAFVCRGTNVGKIPRLVGLKASIERRVRHGAGGAQIASN